MVVLNREQGAMLHHSAIQGVFIMLWFILFFLCGPIVVFGGMMLSVSFGIDLFASMVIMFIGVAIAMAKCS